MRPRETHPSVLVHSQHGSGPPEVQYLKEGAPRMGALGLMPPCLFTILCLACHALQARARRTPSAGRSGGASSRLGGSTTTCGSSCRQVARGGRCTYRTARTPRGLLHRAAAQSTQQETSIRPCTLQRAKQLLQEEDEEEMEGEGEGAAAEEEQQRTVALRAAAAAVRQRRLAAEAEAQHSNGLAGLPPGSHMNGDGSSGAD